MNIQTLKVHRKKGQSLEDVLPVEVHEDSFPDSPEPNIKTNSVAFVAVDPVTFINGYFVMTDQFPQRSSSEKQYIMVGYNYDVN